MDIKHPFGVVTACHSKDYFLVKATCASVRHFMPEVPICVVVDGDHSIKELEDFYGVIPMPVSSCDDTRLRSICQGSGKSKFCALIEGPFERMLFLDSDVVVWGDVQSPALMKHDFVMMSPFYGNLKHRKSIDHFFYNIDIVGELFPDFQWLGKPFFCTGAFSIRRRLFHLDAFLECEAILQKNPGLFKFSDQGIINFLVQRSIQAGGLDFATNEMQYIMADYARNESRMRFKTLLWRLPPRVEQPAIIHICGQKPLIQNTATYSAPFTAARIEHYKRVFCKSAFPIIWALLRIGEEELCIFVHRLQLKLFGVESSQLIFSRRLFSNIRRKDQPARKVHRSTSLLDLHPSEVSALSDFGIVTACHAKDYFMAKATCASIRYFMPDVPICVIVDGDFDITELQKIYGVIVMRTAEIRDARLREMCCRSTRSKLAAQWEGPFERYLWVDCDTVVLGDIVHAEPWGEADFWPMTSIEPGTVPDRNLRHYFLDPDEMKRIDAAFDANKHALFCDGAYVTRRGCLDLDRTYYMWKKTQFLPHLFSWTKCQGLTNYIVFSSESCGELSVRACDRQYIVPDHARLEFEQKFGVAAKLPPREFANPSVVHFCGVKPLIQNWYAPSSLFTAFRILHYSNVYGGRPLATFRSWAKILREEFQMLKPRLFRKLFIK